MAILRYGAAIALLAVTACGGGASGSDVVEACKASVEAQEKEMAAKYSSYTPPSAAVMEEKLECCSRMIEGGKIPGAARSFLLKEYEYRTLRSTTEDDAAVMEAQDALREQRDKLSDKEREAASGVTTLVSSCVMRAGRER
ncbi:MAG: hypothetical protein ACLFV8_07875 [Alphaproteobacteria bacterium]